MVFSSTIFLFMFLPITLVVYYVIKEKYRNYWLILVSILFFSWSQPQFLYLILLSAFINYASAMLMHKEKLKKIILWVCILANLGMLIYFKYFNFILDTLGKVLNRSFDVIDVALPIGISFFTFQGISYVTDVYKNLIPAQKNPFKVMLYIVLFPKLIQGPIVRYKDIAQEIDCREITVDDFAEGMERFIIGLAKKVIIANTMASVVDNIWNAGPGNNSVAVAWLGSIAYAIQIFYDFSGYSDMAIGLGRILGFHFMENFDRPYISRSITEFWRRWHISLSTWFRDYVYIPLGGNRRHVYLNLAIVFLLTGIWHGSSWNFIFWGIWHGIFILIERVLKKRNHKIGKSVFGLIYTLFIVNMGWVLFRAESLHSALLYFSDMFGVSTSNGITAAYYMNPWTIFVGLVSILFVTRLPNKVSNKIKSKAGDSLYIEILRYVLLLIIFVFSIIKAVSGTYSPFIYFQF